MASAFNEPVGHFCVRFIDELRIDARHQRMGVPELPLDEEQVASRAFVGEIAVCVPQ